MLLYDNWLVNTALTRGVQIRLLVEARLQYSSVGRVVPSYGTAVGSSPTAGITFGAVAQFG